MIVVKKIFVISNSNLEIEILKIYEEIEIYEVIEIVFSSCVEVRVSNFTTTKSRKLFF